MAADMPPNNQPDNNTAGADTKRPPARPSLFAAPHTPGPATEARINVLGALNPEPPPAPPKGLRSRSTIAMLAVSVAVLVGLIYMLSQSGNTDDVFAEPPALADRPAAEPAQAQPANTPAGAAPSLAADQPPPAGATIENLPVDPAHAPASNSTTANAVPTHSAPGNPLNALASPQKGTPPAAAVGATAASNNTDSKEVAAARRPQSPILSALTGAQSAPAASSAPAAARSTARSNRQADAVDTDVLLLEALVSYSKHQKASEAAKPAPGNQANPAPATNPGKAKP